MDTPDISSILSSLSEEDVENLKSAAQSIFGGQNSAPKNDPPPVQNNNPFNSFDPNMLGKIGNMMNLLNGSSNDERCALLSALKPLLSEERRHKADEAIKMVQIMELIPKLREQGIF